MCCCSDAFVTKHAHCILGAPFSSICVICNSKILPNIMCYFAFFWLLKNGIFDVLITHHVGKNLEFEIIINKNQNQLIYTGQEWILEPILSDREMCPLPTALHITCNISYSAKYIKRLAPLAPQEVLGDSLLERLCTSANHGRKWPAY